MKNLAGNTVSIFLFKFVTDSKRIHFVLNEAIAEDMYPEVNKQMKPLVHACSETLLRYKNLCVGETIMDGNGETIMDGNILNDGCFEVMLKKGLGKHFNQNEKQNLFKDANEIAEMLMDVMARRTKEIESGIYPGAQKIEKQRAQDKENIKRGLEALGNKKKKEVDDSIRPGLRQLRPEDLPAGVVASVGYDHRGHCVVFEHEQFGDLGRIVLVNMGDNKTLLQADFCEDQESGVSMKEKRELFEEVVRVVNEGFSQF